MLYIEPGREGIVNIIIWGIPGLIFLICILPIFIKPNDIPGLYRFSGFYNIDLD